MPLAHIYANHFYLTHALRALVAAGCGRLMLLIGIAARWRCVSVASLLGRCGGGRWRRRLVPRWPLMVPMMMMSVWLSLKQGCLTIETTQQTLLLTYLGMGVSLSLSLWVGRSTSWRNLVGWIIREWGSRWDR